MSQQRPAERDARRPNRIIHEVRKLDWGQSVYRLRLTGQNKLILTK